MSLQDTVKKMLENKFIIIQNYFKEKNFKVDSATFTTDIWTVIMQTRNFLGMTMFFLSGDKIDSVTLGVYDLTQSHKAEYLPSIILQCCEDCGIKTGKVQAVGKTYHIPCFALMLNLVAE